MEDRIRELASSLLPFAIVPDLCVSLRQRLLLEEEHKKQLSAKEFYAKKLEEVKAKIKEQTFWNGISLDANHRTLIVSRISETIDATAELLTSSKIQLIHEVSEPDQRKLAKWIEESSTSLRSELKTVTVELESSLQELRSVEESLFRVPAEENVAPLMQQINNLHKELGSLTKEMQHIEERMIQASFEFKENERRIAKIAEEQRQIQSEKERMALSSKVQDVLSEFSTRLRRQKLKDVSDSFVDSFNELSSKKNRVNKIAIEEKDFSITLFRKNGTALFKDELSTGEKQIYAIAMLTALARVSGRPIPFVIDTPLARLDIEHRSNLVSNFFPKVSHQVVIFSTDTEIDRAYFEQLAPFISKAYLLLYGGDDSTTVSEGYFWRADKA